MASKSEKTDKEKRCPLISHNWGGGVWGEKWKTEQRETRLSRRCAHIESAVLY